MLDIARQILIWGYLAACVRNLGWQVQPAGKSEEKKGRRKIFTTTLSQWIPNTALERLFEPCLQAMPGRKHKFVVVSLFDQGI